MTLEEARVLVVEAMEFCLVVVVMEVPVWPVAGRRSVCLLLPPPLLLVLLAMVLGLVLVVVVRVVVAALLLGLVEL